MSTAIVLHPVTARQLAAFVKRSTHAVLLSGPVGSGKGVVARQLAADLLGIDLVRLADYPYLKMISPEDGKAISIEAVRTIEQFIRLKVPGDKNVSRIIIIEDAHKLGHEAQNALLKTLEEPPAGTALILTVASEEALLPTIRSRTATISIKRPAQSDLEVYFGSKGYSAVQMKQAIAVSGGLPGLLSALLAKSDHPLAPATVMARQLLGQSTYERLTTVDELSKQRALAEDTLFILQQMAHMSLQQATAATSSRWQKVLIASYEAAEALAASGQPKLVLTKLMLQLA